jgi:subtilisin family serine protease
MRQLFFLVLILFTLTLTAQEKVIGYSVTNDLLNQMEQLSDNELIRINIRLTDQYDVQNLEEAFPALDRAGRRALVTGELKSFSQRTQKGILELIDSKAKESKAELIYSLWISNVITAMASKELIYELSQRSDIDRIDWDEERNLLMAQESVLEGGDDSPEGTLEITYNVNIMNVPAVWALGFQGQGVVVAVLDTGVNYNHADLESHMWTHPSYPNHGWNFIENNNDPMDYQSHGTHCAGTVASDGTAGSQAGMAPLAQIMALKILNNSGGGTESGVWAGIQFAIDYGADVLSLSLGWQQSWGPDRLTWRNTFNNALAAGVISAVAAGNEGTSPGVPNNLRTPGDVPPPWLHPDQTTTGGISGVVSVGATNSSDVIASFSSRGPVTWQTVSPFNDYPYNPGMGLLRPDVTAPGVDVKSCSHTNNNGYLTMSGTSMATPGVAGVMALLLSKNPNLTPAEISMALELTSVDLGTAGKDNTYGTGRVNALAAINYVNYPGPVYSSHSIVDPNSNGQIEAGESILLSIEMYNGSDTPRTNVNVSISTDSPYITITDNSEFYGNFAAWQYKTVTNGFAFNVAANTPGMEDVRFNISATDGVDTWTSFFDVVTYGPRIQFGAITISDPSGNNNGRLDPGETADLLIAAQNIGQVPINNVLATISSMSSYITLNTTQYSIPSLPASGSVDAIFNLTVSAAAPIGTLADFNFNMVSGVYSNQKSVYLPLGLILEDWETGNFASYPWTFGGNAPWTITSVDPYEGVYSAKSGVITHNQTTDLIVQLHVASADNISFFRRVSSEANFDYLRFFIDGVQQAQWAGEVAWSQVSFPVSAGLRTFTWRYYKDGSVSSGSDCSWVDYIVFPPIIPPPAPPEIALNPMSFEVSLPVDAIQVKQLSIANTGEVSLSFNVSRNYIYSGKSPLGVEELIDEDQLAMNLMLYEQALEQRLAAENPVKPEPNPLIGPADSFCAPAFTYGCSGYADGFTGFGLEQIQNLNSGCADNTGFTGWSTYFGLGPAVLDAGQQYTVTMRSGFANQWVNIWIDFNDDDVLTEDERVLSNFNLVTANIWYNATITIPENAQPGLHKMRAMAVWSSQFSNPCGSYSYGEAEDYTVLVNSNFVDWLTLDPTTGTVPGSGSTTVDLTFNSTGMELGTYYADVTITSNDPVAPSVIIPCTLHVVGEINVGLTAMVEGGFEGSSMTTYLNNAGLLPLTQPFNTAPWNYAGSESVAVIPNSDVADWVLVELRETTGSASDATPATMVSRQAGFLLNDGSIVDIDGSSMLRFDVVVNDNLFVIVHHRNHLGIMSANPVIQTAGNYMHDFTTGSGQAHGDINAQKQILPGVWGMIAGDINADGIINMADKSPEWDVLAGEAGYHKADLNFDGQVNNMDKDDFLIPNQGNSSYTPN